MKEFKVKKYIIASVIIFTIVLAFYVYYFTKEFGFHIVANHNNWGQFGDYIGGVLSSFFAFFSFIALLYTINLQRIDINDKRIEAKEQKEIAVAQRKILDIQLFETTFFNMLNQITHIIDSYTFNQQQGASYFKNAMMRLWDEFGENYTNSEEIDKYLKKTKLHKEFKNFILHVSNIIKIIVESKLTEDEKNKYYEILYGFLAHRQKYFLEVCFNSSKYFPDEKQYIGLIHRRYKKRLEEID